MPHRLPIARVVVAAVLLVTGVLRLGLRPTGAAAAVHHVSGYEATVLGFTSWYGSYDLGGLGVAWCIDHGIAAPDPALVYARTPVADASADTRAALAWLFGSQAGGTDRIGSAALMLVAHDLMGASYPFGRLDVDRLTPAQTFGFGTDTDLVLVRARALKADALAHRQLRAPYVLTLDPVPPSLPGTEVLVVARLTDSAGHAVPGVVLHGTVDAGATMAGEPAPTTDAGGTATFLVEVADVGYRVDVEGSAPDLDLHAYGPTRARAQRVAQPATATFAGSVAGTAAPTTTSTAPPTTAPPTTIAPPTTAPPLTTAPPPTTATTAAPTTTAATVPVSAAELPTTTPTTAPATTTMTVPPTTFAAPPPTAAPPAPPSPPAAPPPARSLPRTGADPAGLASTGSGLIVLGAAIRARRDRRRR